MCVDIPSVCISMHSYASVTDPYAPIWFHTPQLCFRMPILNTRVRLKSENSNHSENRKVIIAIGSVKVLRIQPNIVNRPSIGIKSKQYNDMV